MLCSNGVQRGERFVSLLPCAGRVLGKGSKVTWKSTTFFLFHLNAVPCACHQNDVSLSS